MEYHEIESLKLEKEKTALIASYSQTYNAQTKCYYQMNEIQYELRKVIQKGYDTFLCMCHNAFEISCAKELLELKKDYPIKVYFVCLKKKNIEMVSWRNFVNQTDFVSIQEKMDGSYYFTENQNYYNYTKFLDSVVQKVSCIIGNFALSNLVVSTIVKLAKEYHCSFINIFDDRSKSDIGNGLHYDLLFNSGFDEDFQKSLKLCYSYHYGKMIRENVLKSQEYNEVQNENYQIIQQLSRMDITMKEIKRLAVIYDSNQVHILKLIAQAANDIAQNVTQSDITAMAKNRKRSRKKRNTDNENQMSFSKK